MPDPMDEARAAVANLADTDEDDLYRLLALRVKTIERDPAIAGQFAPTTMAATELGIAMPDLACARPEALREHRARRPVDHLRDRLRGRASTSSGSCPASTWTSRR